MTKEDEWSGECQWIARLGDYKCLAFPVDEDKPFGDHCYGSCENPVNFCPKYLSVNACMYLVDFRDSVCKSLCLESLDRNITGYCLDPRKEKRCGHHTYK